MKRSNLRVGALLRPMMAHLRFPSDRTAEATPCPWVPIRNFEEHSLLPTHFRTMSVPHKQQINPRHPMSKGKAGHPSTTGNKSGGGRDNGPRTK